MSDYLLGFAASLHSFMTLETAAEIVTFCRNECHSQTGVMVNQVYIRRAEPGEVVADSFMGGFWDHVEFRASVANNGSLIVSIVNAPAQGPA